MQTLAVSALFITHILIYLILLTVSSGLYSETETPRKLPAAFLIPKPNLCFCLTTSKFGFANLFQVLTA